VNSSALQQGDLGGGFGFDFGCDFCARRRSGCGAVEQTKKLRQRGAESAGGCLGQVGKIASSRENRFSIEQNHMAADAEGGCGTRDIDGVGSGGSARHECCAGEETGLVQLGDGTIYALCQAEVVRVDDETPHRVSLSIVAGGSGGTLNLGARVILRKAADVTEKGHDCHWALNAARYGASKSPNRPRTQSATLSH